ncbi:MAG: hypothetical protein K2X81_23925 [Candidatus Obscuribacterales bacterium]|nr:hypothetical protein [Candidatus Obscuribacterales bacterium]
MNKSKSKRIRKTESLIHVLDQSVEVAAAMKLSEADLVEKLLERMHAKTSNVIELNSQPRKMYDPSAGP